MRAGLAAVVSGNGAMPPIRWQEAHLASRIGATSRLYVGRGGRRCAARVGDQRGDGGRSQGGEQCNVPHLIGL